MTERASTGDFDAVIVGSGFGGSMVAQALVDAGWRVVMLERGDWVRRGPENWAPDAVGTLTPYFSTETPYRALAGGESDVVGSFHCVGGPSVFFGGVTLRFREKDFTAAPEIAGGSGADWPITYTDLEPHYAQAEALLGVAGELGADPTEPFHSGPYPQLPAALSPISRMIRDAARQLGLHPSRLPLAFNHRRQDGRAPCAACMTCDLFACAIEAKNDLATVVLPDLLRRGLQLETNVVAVRLATEGRRITAVECLPRQGGAPVRYTGRLFILSAGALAISPPDPGLGPGPPEPRRGRHRPLPHAPLQRGRDGRLPPPSRPRAARSTSSSPSTTTTSATRARPARAASWAPSSSSPHRRPSW